MLACMHKTICALWHKNNKEKIIIILNKNGSLLLFSSFWISGDIVAELFTPIFIFDLLSVSILLHKTEGGTDDYA